MFYAAQRSKQETYGKHSKYYILFYAGFKRQVIKKICSPDYSLNFLQNPIWWYAIMSIRSIALLLRTHIYSHMLSPFYIQQSCNAIFRHIRISKCIAFIYIYILTVYRILSGKCISEKILETESYCNFKISRIYKRYNFVS